MSPQLFLEGLASVIIINWNGKSFLPACIKSVVRQKFDPMEIIIVDNASTDNSLYNLPKESVVIRNDTNRGFAVAANQGIKKSVGEYIFVLNQDVTLDNDFIKRVCEDFAQNETIGLVSGKIMRMNSKAIDSAGQFMNRWAKPIERGYNEKDRGIYEETEDIFSVCGAVACYHRSMLEDVKVGEEYFDENFFAFYEDLDLGWRAQLRGWKGRYDPKARAYHYRGSTKGKSRFQILGRPKDLQFRIILNRYLMVIKNASKVHMILYSPFFLVRFLIDLFFVIIFIPKLFSNIKETIVQFVRAFKKRSIIQKRRKVSDKMIRKLIV